LVPHPPSLLSSRYLGTVPRGANQPDCEADHSYLVLIPRMHEALTPYLLYVCMVWCLGTESTFFRVKPTPITSVLQLAFPFAQNCYCYC